MRHSLRERKITTSRIDLKAPLLQTQRNFIFLQGPTSGVFRDLGRALAQRGHTVERITLCPGDWLFWRGRDTIPYRGTLAAWPAFLEARIAAREATDIVYFADRFPYHKAAQRVARRLGLRPISMEYGYLRPDWLILEEGGQSTYSHFPSDASVLRSAAQNLPRIQPGALHAIPTSVEALCEAGFHLSNAFLGWLFPQYAPDRYYPVLQEFPAYVPRFLRRARNARRASALITRLARLEKPLFLVPLQMQNDYQLRDNAPPGYQLRFIREVLDSFATAAPRAAHLIFKLHPLDNGLERWDLQIRALRAQAGLDGRVHVLDGGDLSALLAIARGCVVINSTTGLHALRALVPTKVCGVSVYDIDGLTHQGPLAGFWTDPQPPEPDLLDDFVCAIAHGIHVRGAVYGASGRAAFVAQAIRRLEAPRLHAHDLHVAIPPRLEHARRLGINVDWPAERVAR